MFDRVVCINLKRRPERWKRFQMGLPRPCPFGDVERIEAVDSQLARPPEWYGRKPDTNHPPRDDWAAMTRGAWGCLRSHVRAWEDCLSAGIESVLIFEDDAVFHPEFVWRYKEFIEAVPDDWGQIYLGGQHLPEGNRLPVVINDSVLRGRNVNRTHAYAIRRETMLAAYHLMSGQWQPIRAQDYHIDHRLGTLHETHKAYCPRQWLVGQAAGASDVWGKMAGVCWWNQFGVVEERAHAFAG